MSHKFNSSNCSLINDSSECSVLAKLRRLKIEENLLINNINKNQLKEINGDNVDFSAVYSLDFKNYATKLKNTFTEIKNTFGDIKTVTEDKLSEIDIANVKRDVIKLDDRIRIFKHHIQTELTSATSKEQELTKQINNVEEKQLKYTFKDKTRMKLFNHIVPSPVKVMIQSPFKCKEVQQFQEFMMSSTNRYGGWNEYHHNVFVQTWHKFFNSNEVNEFNHGQEILVENYEQFQAFLREIMQKISGSTKDDIILHFKWYCKYLYLKEQQQNALNKWKINKRMLSNPRYKQNDNDNRDSDRPKQVLSNAGKLPTNMENVEELLDTMDTHDAEEIANALCDMTLQDDGSFDTEINMSIGIGDDRASEDTFKPKQRLFTNILKPTKQWTSRCNSSHDSVKGNNDLDTIRKLRVPEWRLPLQE